MFHGYTLIYFVFPNPSYELYFEEQNYKNASLNYDMFATCEERRGFDTNRALFGTAHRRIIFGFTTLYNAEIARCASKGQNRCFIPTRLKCMLEETRDCN